MKSVESLSDHRANIHADMMVLGYHGFSNSSYYKVVSPKDIWDSVQSMIAYDSKELELPVDELADFELRTEFGRRTLALLMMTPSGSFTDQRAHSSNIVCTAAEGGFIQSFQPASDDYGYHAPLLLEKDGEINAVMKFNEFGERTILGLTDNDGLIAGAIYAFSDKVEQKVLNARPCGGPVIAPAEDFYEYTGPLYPQRTSTFMLDHNIRRDFSEAVYNNEYKIVGVDHLYKRANGLLKTQQKQARKRGHTLLFGLKNQ